MKDNLPHLESRYKVWYDNRKCGRMYIGDMLKINDYKNKKKEAYFKEIDEVIKRFDEDQEIEARLNREDIRMMNGVDPVLDPFDLLREISETGTALKTEIARINSKYGIPGDKVKEDWE